VQLKLTGTLHYNGSSRDLTLAACGTVYTVSDERVLSVSRDGLVTVHGSGEAEVTASTERLSDWVKFKVDLPVTPDAATAAQRPLGD
jgi:hypothetical protein